MEAVLKLFNWLVEQKLIMLAPGWASLVLIGYIEFFQIPDVNAAIADVDDMLVALRVDRLEQKMDAIYSALCMNPGDQVLVERVRELQQQYDAVVVPDRRGDRYDPPSCDLLLKIR